MFSFLFPPPKPFMTGYLPEEDGHRVFFQVFGKPDGYPVLAFHGGPGSCGKASHTESFDLKRQRVILFDQRGCGLSEPAGETRHNTTRDLVSDAARLLRHLGIARAGVRGGSWGATLALLFAQAHPEMVDRLIIAQTFLARRADIDWINKHAARLYPDIIDTLMQDVPEGMTLRQHYARLMASGDAAQQARATSLYGSYERMIGSLSPRFADTPPDPAHIAAFRIYMHYDSMDYGIAEDEVLSGMARIAHIPALIVHNRGDMVCPVDQSYLVHRALPQSQLVIVPDRGHVSKKLYREITRHTRLFLQDAKITA